jgi:hypothetical protein
MKSVWFALGITCVSAAGCYSAPARTSAPAELDGVKMAIVGQYCEDSAGLQDFAGSPVVQLRLQIAVANRGPGDVAFDPARLRVIAPDRVTPSPVGADSAFVLAPGASKLANVRFMTRGSMKCRKEMQLDPSDSLVAGAKHISLPRIAFVAEDGS